MNAAKEKGTKAETAVVRFLRENGYPHAERRALAGAADRGDVAGVPGVVIEVKNCERLQLAQWVGEANEEARSNPDTPGVVWHKRRGIASPGDWYVTMDGWSFLAFLEGWAR